MAGAGSLCFFQFAPPEQTCLSCHEIQEPYNRWAAVDPSQVSCKRCHGGTLTSGIHGLRRESQAAACPCPRHLPRRHAAERGAGRGDQQPVRAVPRPRVRPLAERRPRDQLLRRSSSTKSTTGPSKWPTIASAATECSSRGRWATWSSRLDIKGPWRLKDATAGRSARDSLPGLPSGPRGGPSASPKGTVHARRDENWDSRCDRASGTRFASTRAASERTLPRPTCRCRRSTITAGRLQVSTDPRQRVCVQCHAPDAFGQAGTSDDRTPRGRPRGAQLRRLSRPAFQQRAVVVRPVPSEALATAGWT